VDRPKLVRRYTLLLHSMSPTFQFHCTEDSHEYDHYFAADWSCCEV